MPTDQRLLNRLRQLEHDAAQEERDGLLNPDADLGGLDPAWVAEEVARCRADPEYFIDNYCKVEADTGRAIASKLGGENLEQVAVVPASLEALGFDANARGALLSEQGERDMA